MLNRSPLRVAVLCSHRAPGLRHLLLDAARRGTRWDIVCCVTSEETFEEEALAREHRIDVVHHPLRRFRDAVAPQARLGDVTLRQDYDRRTLELLVPYAPDILVLAGYLLLLTKPVLTAFEGRILNVHHSDLALRDASGAPKYAGLRAVRDAIRAGEIETRSTIHLVTERLDDGPPLLRSEPFPVPQVAFWAMAAGEEDVLRKAIWAHQEWMLRAAFGPLMERALDIAAAQTRQALAS
jgi:folate-dependent phosphoribosylglycinamide formyltransferase PurN